MEAIQRRKNDSYEDTLEDAMTSIFYPLDNLVDILIEANDNTETIVAAVTESAKARAMEFVKLIEKEVGPISFKVAQRRNSLGVRGGSILAVKVGNRELAEVAA